MEDIEMEREWRDVGATAKHFAISEPTLCRWMHNGRLTYYRVGESTRFRCEDIDTVSPDQFQEEPKPPFGEEER